MGKLIIGSMFLIATASAVMDADEEERIMRLIQARSLAIITIMQEAAGEAFEGKVAVAEVIRNRMNAKYQSDGTIEGTVLRPLQFSGWNATDPGRIRSVRSDGEDPVVKECIEAWHMALNDNSNTVNGALLYYNPRIIKIPPKWALPEHAVLVKEVGQHHFFIPKTHVKDVTKKI